MKIPELHGQFESTDTVFYIASDEKYFNIYGKPLISSIRANFSYPIHCHVYNPSEETLGLCKKIGISVTYEFFSEDLILKAYDFYKFDTTESEYSRRRSKMIKLGEDVEKIRTELVRTYYACARFIRLDQILSKPTYVIMLDTDSLVRKQFVLPKNNFDIHIFEKTHKKHVPYTQHLASTIFYTGTDRSLELIRQHSKLISEEFDKDTFYWFLDQETLDVAIQKFKKNPLNKQFVDFEMNKNSYIWCAKGQRKFTKIYLDEIKKYQIL